MNQPPDRILADVRRQLGELRESTARSQMLVGDIQASLNRLTPGPAESGVPAPQTQQAPQPVMAQPTIQTASPGTMPQHPAQPAPLHPQPQSQMQSQPKQPVVPPKSPKPKLSTEQLVLRWAAIIGSIITFVGACFGIALAIQTGLLGPAGRVVGAALLAFILLGVGIRVDRRKGSNVGVIALYVTSFLILIADLWYAVSVQGWINPIGGVTVFLAVWLSYLALAKWRNSLQLILAMCIILVFHSFYLFTDDNLINGLVMVAPIAVILLTWWMAREASPRLIAIVRGTAGALLAWQTYLLAFSIPLFFDVSSSDEPINFAVTFPLIGLVLLVIGEIFFAAPGAQRAHNIVSAVVVPAIILVASYSLLRDTGTWLPFLIAAAMTVLVTVIRPRNKAEFSSDLLTGWLIVLPFTFFQPFIESQDFTGNTPKAEAIPVLIFIAVAITVLMFLHRLQVNTLAVVASWAFMLLVGVLPMLAYTLNPSTPTRWSWFTLIQGLLLAALLVIAVTRKALWHGVATQARAVFAGYGLILEMLAVVTIVDLLWRISTEVAGAPSEAVVESSRMGFYNGHMIVSISWMAAASWLLLKRPGAMDTKTLRTTGLVMAIVATGKLVFFDMAALGGIPRVLTFIVCGLLLIAVAIKGAQRKTTAANTSPADVDVDVLERRN